ncbi:MBL fold metallo-hydrolase [Nitratidesulfovibrio sp. D1]|uniref:MBL fold metallo-hydrolase n=1 Tax=Nitratidesulfovibrio sp. D1 TaxID=3440151 RepID=UPI003EBACC37
MLDRRRFVQSLLALVPLATLTTMTAATANAASPATGTGGGAPAAPPTPHNTQAPGFFRLPVGGVTVFALFDAHGKLDPAILHGADRKDIDALLEDAGIPAGQPATSNVNCFLLDAGTRRVLMDTGAGSFFGARGGYLPGNLRAAGYAPGGIDHVLLSHLHPDHALGLVDAAGARVFPNASVHVSAPELDYWTSDATLAAAPEGRKAGLLALRKALAPYRDAGRLHTFAPGAAPLPDLPLVTSVDLPGHTPGHCGFRVTSGGTVLLFWADIIHSTPVQFARPEVSIDFDVDQKAAVATRLRLLPQVAAEGCWVAGSHLPFPGLGRVRARDGGKGGYAWLPVNYADGL